MGPGEEDEEGNNIPVPSDVVKVVGEDPRPPQVLCGGTRRSGTLAINFVGMCSLAPP